MGVSSRENGILKLVHPGRHVETHKVPIIAAEILQKYPRHCIARPDVFRFPWIVVRPESILHLGKVFYLVPHRTLYNLLKNNNTNPIRHHHHHHHHQSYACFDPLTTTTRTTSRENNQFSRNDEKNSKIKCWGGGIITPKQCNRRTSRYGYRDRETEGGGYQSDTSYVDTWAQITDRLKKLQLTPYQPRQTVDYQCNLDKFQPRRQRKSAAEIVPSTMDTVRQRGRGNQEVGTKLKSCLREQDSARKLLNLKVNFGPSTLIPFSPTENSSLV